MTTFRMSPRPPARDVFFRSNAASVAAPRISAVPLQTTAALARRKPTWPSPVRLSARLRPAAVPPYPRQQTHRAVALSTLAAEVAPCK